MFVADAIREQVFLIFFISDPKDPCFYIFSSCKSRKTAMMEMYF